MSLKDRLDALTGEAAKPFQADPRQDKISELRRRIDRVMNRREHIVPASIPNDAKKCDATGACLLLARKLGRHTATSSYPAAP